MPSVGPHSAPMAANSFKSPPPMPPFQYSTPGASEQTRTPATETAPPCSPARQLSSPKPYTKCPKRPATTALKVSQFGIKPVLRSQNAANALTTTVTSRNVITAGSCSLALLDSAFDAVHGPGLLRDLALHGG